MRKLPLFLKATHYLRAAAVLAPLIMTNRNSGVGTCNDETADGVRAVIGCNCHSLFMFRFTPAEFGASEPTNRTSDRTRTSHTLVRGASLINIQMTGNCNDHSTTADISG
jgi:hypothetical protein